MLGSFKTEADAELVGVHLRPAQRDNDGWAREGKSSARQCPRQLRRNQFRQRLAFASAQVVCHHYPLESSRNGSGSETGCRLQAMTVPMETLSPDGPYALGCLPQRRPCGVDDGTTQSWIQTNTSPYPLCAQPTPALGPCFQTTRGTRPPCADGSKTHRQGRRIASPPNSGWA